jgi:hypothetical protein
VFVKCVYVSEDVHGNGESEAVAVSVDSIITYTHFINSCLLSSGVEARITKTVSLARMDLLSAAQKHLVDFTDRISVSDLGSAPPTKRLKSSQEESVLSMPPPLLISIASDIDSLMTGMDAATWVREKNVIESESDYITSINAESDGVRKAQNVLQHLDIPLNTVDKSANFGSCGHASSSIASLKDTLYQSNVCVVDVGASVGSNCMELTRLLVSNSKHAGKKLSYGIIIEYMAEACYQAVEYAHKRGFTVSYVQCPGISEESTLVGRKLSELYKRQLGDDAIGHVYIFQGDATLNMTAVNMHLQQMYEQSVIDCVVVTCHAVLHELPSRSPNFNFENLADNLLLSTGIKKWVMYAREPSFPEEPEWQPGKDVHLQIPGWLPDQLRDLAKHLADHLPGLKGRDEGMKLISIDEFKNHCGLLDKSNESTGSIVTGVNRAHNAYSEGILAAETRSGAKFLRIDALLAMELLYKTLFYVGSKHLLYESGEQLTSFESRSFMSLLSDHCKADNVVKTRYTSGTFEQFWNLWHPRIWDAQGTRMRSMPIPSTLIIGWRGFS